MFKDNPSISYCGDAAKQSTLQDELNLLTRRVEEAEDSVRRLYLKLFGEQPAALSNIEVCAPPSGKTDIQVFRSDIRRASYSAERARDVLQEMEALLG